MCPDPQLLSIYVDGELPSPWDEKMDSHLKECPTCRRKVENFKQLRELINQDPSAQKTSQEELLKSKEKIWRRLEEKRRFTQYPRVWQRRISIPLPAAAAAAIIIALIIIFFSRGGQILNNGFAGKKANPDERSNFILAAEEEIPGIIPSATDLNGVLQYLGADGSEIIILKLPESKNFSRSGEPAIIRAADYSRRHP
ncbi:anti-sigma factor family protein [Treponema sp. R80B11-R83G3]